MTSTYKRKLLIQLMTTQCVGRIIRTVDGNQARFCVECRRYLWNPIRQVAMNFLGCNYHLLDGDLFGVTVKAWPACVVCRDNDDLYGVNPAPIEQLEEVYPEPPQPRDTTAHYVITATVTVTPAGTNTSQAV